MLLSESLMFVALMNRIKDGYQFDLFVLGYGNLNEFTDCMAELADINNRSSLKNGG